MKQTKRLAAILTATAATAIAVPGAVQAQGGLLAPLICGNVAQGDNNQQTANCNQSSTTPPPTGGLTGNERKFGPSVEVPPNGGVNFARAQCSPGKVATGGGLQIHPSPEFTVFQMRASSPTEYEIGVRNDSPSAGFVSAFVICYDAAS